MLPDPAMVSGNAAAASAVDAALLNDVIVRFG